VLRLLRLSWPQGLRDAYRDRTDGLQLAKPACQSPLTGGFSFDALYPRYRGGRPRTFTLPERQQIKRIALSVLSDLGQPFATWSLVAAPIGCLVARSSNTAEHEHDQHGLVEPAGAPLDTRLLDPREKVTLS
jgi:hypothetical protein